MTSEEKEFLLRVDDRGIHGQVVVGWLGRANIKRIVLCQERQEIQKDFYAMSIPEGVKFSLLSKDEVIKSYQEGSLDSGAKTTLIVCYSLKTACELIAGGLRVREVNIGGLHSAEGKKRFLDFVYLSPEDMSYLKKILAAGAEVFAYELPDSRRYNIRELLREK